MAWYDVDEDERVRPAEIIPAKPDPLAGVPHQKWLVSRQRKIFLDSAQVLEDALAARELDVDADGPPEEWIRDLGEKEAKRRFRMAQAGWLNAKEAPVVIKVAKELLVGISKAMAADNSGPKVLNLQVVNMPQTANLPEFPEIEDDEP